MDFAVWTILYGVYSISEVKYEFYDPRDAKTTYLPCICKALSVLKYIIRLNTCTYINGDLMICVMKFKVLTPE